MFQKNSHRKPEERGELNLEERLTAYYGSQLPPRPLPEAAWLQLREQLKPEVAYQPRSQSRVHLPDAPRPRSIQPVPAALQETFAALLVQIQYSRSAPELRCTFKRNALPPQISISPLGRGQIRLALPRQSWQALQLTELEVMIAASLARYIGTSRASFLLQRGLLGSGLLVSVATLPLAMFERRFLWIVLLALICCLAGIYLLAWQQRAMAFQADRQAVQWLGRERMCRGLHGLAEYGRSQRRPALGEPSLAERIARVCGTSVTSKDERLTLVH